MANAITLNPAEKRLIDWLQEQADNKGVEVRMHVDLMRRDNGWMYLPFHVKGNIAAHEKTQFMQDIEDSWNFQDPEIQLLLIPASD